LLPVSTLVAQTKSGSGNQSPETGQKKSTAVAAPVSPKPAAPKAAAHKPPSTAATPASPLLPPILHDFSSLLSPSKENATPAELKNLAVFVTTDKGNSYLATVETLALDYAIVTNPVPANKGETPVSVLIGKAGTPSIAVPLSGAEVTKSVIVSGDFTKIFADHTTSDCKGLSACAELLDTDGATKIGDITDLTISQGAIAVTFKAPAGAKPAYLRVGRTKPSAFTYPFTPETPSSAKNNLVDMRQVIAGDFCQEDPKQACTTEFLKSPDQALSKITAAYVLQAVESEFRPATVNAIGKTTVDVSFSAPAAFRPAYLVLDSNSQSYRFAYTPAAPIQTTISNYESDELGEVCDLDCAHKDKPPLTLKSLSGGSEATLVALAGNLIVANITAPLGQEPSAISVTHDDTKRSIVARRTITPGGNVNELQVSMTIMDQITATRNYGNRIAKRYIAVTLDVKNPTSKKLQFNKSALYFDVDYVEAKENKRLWRDFYQTVGITSTFGLWQPSVYESPFVALRSDKKPRQPSVNESPSVALLSDKKKLRVARFGLEQNVKQSPVSYLSALGSFDQTTEETDAKLKTVELIRSVLTAIATGGVVADASGSFRAGTAIFSSTFLPGVRAIVLNTSTVNRLRSNLVAQTLQETIQLSANSSASTIVLLPRAGILAFTDAKIPVIVDRLIDVHLVPEVVTPITATPTEKSTCKPGYTKDQSREALGEPTGVTPNADGSSTFTYKSGAVASADFDAKGLLIGCKTRTPSDQLDLATTLVEMNEILSNLKLTANKIELTDDSTVLVDIPGVQKTYHFDTKGNRASDYTFLFADITAEKGKSKADFEKFLEDKADALSKTRGDQIRTQSASKAVSDKVTYGSPDIKNGSLVVTFKPAPPAQPNPTAKAPANPAAQPGATPPAKPGATAAAQPGATTSTQASAKPPAQPEGIDQSSLVDQITFEGDKPNSTK